MAELTLKQMILNKIDNQPRGYAEILSTTCNYSSGSALKKVLFDSKKEFEKFNSLLDIVKIIWESDSIEMMIKYSNEIDPNKKTARNFLEYLVRQREFESFNSLLDKMDKCTNKESNEWSKIYRMQYKYELSQTTDDYNKLIGEINKIHVTVPELKVYKKMLISYCFDQTHDYKITKFLVSEIKQEIELIENDYIKEMYVIRFNELMSNIQLRVLNNPELARKYADKIIDADKSEIAFKAYAYYIKGHSYLFTSHEKTLSNCNKSIELYSMINRTNDIEEIKEIIEFANVYWDKMKAEKCSFLKNQLLLQIKNKENISLDMLEPEFKLYYEGYAEKDNKKLMLSLIKFIKNSDLFSANLPKIELLKNGYDGEVLDEIININVA